MILRKGQRTDRALKAMKYSQNYENPFEENFRVP